MAARQGPSSGVFLIAYFDLPDYPLAYPIIGLLLGLIIGSFLANLVVRWPRGESVIFQRSGDRSSVRSACDHCGHILGALELIPVISHLAQSGRCKACGGKINTDHLVIELAAGLIGGLALFVRPDLAGLSGALFGWLLLTMAILDLKHYWLPDRLTILLAVFGLLTFFVSPEPGLLDRTLGGIAGFLSLSLVAAGYKRLRGREGLGGGDPKIFAAIGCWLGWEALPLVLLGAGLIGLISIALSQIRRVSVTASTKLPLGSYLALAAFPLWLALAG